jgi:hypothetical protein
MQFSPVSCDFLCIRSRYSLLSFGDESERFQILSILQVRILLSSIASKNGFKWMSFRKKITLSRVKWLQTRFRLVIGFIGLLQIVTTINYSAIANSHTLQFTTARTKFFVCCVFTRRCMVTDPNSVDFSASVFNIFTGRWLSYNSSWLQPLAILCLLAASGHRWLVPTVRRPSHNLDSKRTPQKSLPTSVLLLLHAYLVAVETCLQGSF